MAHNHNPIQVLKDACQHACHERHACTHGYKELMSADTSEGVATVWRKYWRELVSEQYADVICEELPYHYAELQEGFNKAGLYFNECPPASMMHPFVLVGNSDKPIHVYGYADVYILGKAHVIAHDHASVSCVQPQGKVELLDYSKGDINAGYAIARNRSTLISATDCECHNSPFITISHGTLHDHGHMEIKAYGDSVVDSFTDQKITLYDNAKLNIR